MTTPPSDASAALPTPVQKVWLDHMLLSVRLRQAALLLMILYATSLVASVLPLKLVDPRWYLNAADVLMASAPIAITAACLRLLAHGLFPREGDWWRQSHIRFQRFCGLMSLLYFAVLPLEVIAAGVVGVQLDATGRSRLQTLQSQQQLITQRLDTAKSLSELNALLPPVPGQAAASLKERRTAIALALESDRHDLRLRVSKTRHQRRLNLVINGLRILLTALATGFFFRLLARPSSQQLEQKAESLVGI
jgi:hypothetical protein